MTRSTTRYPAGMQGNCLNCACMHLPVCLVLVQGTAFPMSERERLQLRGLLPPRVLTLEAQVCEPCTCCTLALECVHCS